VASSLKKDLIPVIVCDRISENIVYETEFYIMNKKIIVGGVVIALLILSMTFSESWYLLDAGLIIGLILGLVRHFVLGKHFTNLIIDGATFERFLFVIFPLIIQFVLLVLFAFVNIHIFMGYAIGIFCCLLLRAYLR